MKTLIKLALIAFVPFILWINAEEVKIPREPVRFNTNGFLSDDFKFRLKYTVIDEMIGVSRSDILNALRGVRHCIEECSPEPDFTLLYRSPSANLRNQADRIDRNDIAKKRFLEILSKLESSPAFQSEE